jgi:predicted small lipoprotein YifL
MRRLVFLLVCTALVATLTACGNKGELVKPDAAKPTPTPVERDSAKHGNTP